jgi:hypothetical protein
MAQHWPIRLIVALATAALIPTGVTAIAHADTADPTAHRSITASHEPAAPTDPTPTTPATPTDPAPPAPIDPGGNQPVVPPSTDNPPPAPQPPAPQPPKHDKPPGPSTLPLSQRAERQRSKYGRLAGSARTLTHRQRAKAKAKASAVRYQLTRGKRAMYIEVTKAGKPRTWVVTGGQLRRYLKAKGPTGRFGLPTADRRCHIKAAGCLQSFSRGTIYSRPGRIATTPVTGVQGDIIAVARAQVGFKQGGTRDHRHWTKFERWAGAHTAWCSMYVAWAAHHAGHGRFVKKHQDFGVYRSWLRDHVKRIAKPRPGALVIMDGGVPLGHAGLVAEVRGSTYTLLDGNWNMRVRQTKQKPAGQEFYWPY